MEPSVEPDGMGFPMLPWILQVFNVASDFRRRGREGRHSYGDPMTVSNDVVPWLQPSKAISHPNGLPKTRPFNAPWGPLSSVAFRCQKGPLFGVWCYPLVNKRSYGKWPFIVDFPIENGDVL